MFRQTWYPDVQCNVEFDDQKISHRGISYELVHSYDGLEQLKLIMT